MITSYMALLTDDTVRDHVTFGERRRDPQTDAALVPSIQGDVYRPYGDQQPVNNSRVP